jgi:Carboxypeptidase regulatory-like domain
MKPTWPIRAILLLILFQLPLLAQSHITTGLIEGVVRDETGAVLPGVTIRLTHLGIGISRSARTSPEGYFALPLLPVGTYELSARFRGFAAAKRTGIMVAVGETRFLEIVMKPSAIETSIDVEDENSVLDSVQFETSTYVDSREVSSLPLNGRRFLDLALLAPTVYQEKERGQLSLSGARGINSAINVDGADFNQPFLVVNAEASGRPSLTS